MDSANAPVSRNIAATSKIILSSYICTNRSRSSKSASFAISIGAIVAFAGLPASSSCAHKQSRFDSDEKQNQKKCDPIRLGRAESEKLKHGISRLHTSRSRFRIQSDGWLRLSLADFGFPKTQLVIWRNARERVSRFKDLQIYARSRVNAKAMVPIVVRKPYITALGENLPTDQRPWLTLRHHVPNPGVRQRNALRDQGPKPRRHPAPPQRPPP